ncbi:hypothetical protein ACOMICROBIO_FLGHMIGD_04265 [Vibrio sp. B1FLJ16]|uniref:hypothetical protein n=1 Tax=Vibrio sp. B1FLJ16 TaxID=2751178 RepID=UPI0015F39828|nr:hypothetical protein [Vibrio sp. B1FLJ16]CAD7820890.1 hypothetical protein ACOMICROBIO_FLGHMIGD_04265 [Vibrio sp. B1FLJ16]CAE6944612.1 hypothetical protein ACOMICROBIO_FLGHMIGD_04265 [Vibrio sp. B1FLJ16]
MKKSLLVVAMTATGLLAGCGGGSDSSTPESVSQSSVAGVANKGIVDQGLITVCNATAANVADKACPEDEVIANAVTDETGAYSVSGLPQNKALLFVLQNNPDAQTRMKCDYAACAVDGVEFGDWFNVAEDFKLISLVVPESNSLTSHMTNLTDAAAKRAIEIGAGSEISIESVNAGKKYVAEVLGVDAQKLSEIGAVDLTDAEQVKAAVESGDLASIKAATLSAAIADAGQPVEDLWANQTSAVDYSETLRTAILAAATNVIGSVSEKAEDSELLASVEQEIDSDKETKPTISEPEVTDEITAGKNLVKQVRTVYDSVATEDGALRVGFASMEDSLEPIPALLEDDVNGAFDMLASAFSSIAYHINSDLFDEQGEYDVTANGETKTYVIDTDNLKLTVVGSIAIEENESGSCNELANSTECQDGFDSQANIDLKITQLMAKNGAATISAESGEVVIANFSESSEYTGSYEGYNYAESDESSSSADQLSFVLQDLTIAGQDAESTPVTLTGSITATLNDFNYASAELEQFVETIESNVYENTYTYNFDESATFSSLVFTLSGEIAYDQQSMGALIDIRIDNPDGFVAFNDVDEMWSYKDGVSDSSVSEEEGLTQEETETKFIRGSVLAKVNAELNPENPQQGEVSLQVSRTALNTVVVDGHVIYNEEQLNIDSIIDTESDQAPVITISNNNATAELTEDEQGELSGQIKVNGNVVASIDDTDTAVVVRYTNGDFETLF